MHETKLIYAGAGRHSRPGRFPRLMVSHFSICVGFENTEHYTETLNLPLHTTVPFRVTAVVLLQSGCPCILQSLIRTHCCASHADVRAKPPTPSEYHPPSVLHSFCSGFQDTFHSVSSHIPVHDTLLTPSIATRQSTATNNRTGNHVQEKQIA